jgi:hypothetical protein
VNRPGYRTPAFWLGTAATLTAALLASGLVYEPGHVSGSLTLILSALSAMGYTAWRTWEKAGEPGKRPWRTTEFWLSAAATLVSGLYLSGLVSTGSIGDQALGFVAALLTAAGYGIIRKRA